ncbi:DNA ligase D [Lysobacter cavernae]|uniref:DNA ligase (ATP) n=1 Tax=Lysobacter cavernae TaxID=1685901 RepID=A0ABV7RPU2_9GAMM
MSLRDYARKRRLGETPEPGDATRKPRARGKPPPIFVVQLHHARARHYDFRLEADGVLKSWAVPKGPSLRPGEKRLAIEVEDHPLAYAGFQGDIPEGHYGAGHVDIFDRGTWSTSDDPLAQIAAGKLDFELDGEKLKGSFHMVRTRPSGRQPQWLLIKRNDRYARDADADALLIESAPKAPRAAKAGQVASERNKAVPRRPAAAARGGWKARAVQIAGRAAAKPMPEEVELQLTTLRETPPATGDWLHEVKWDGYRMLAYKQRGKVRLQSRKGLDWTGDFPELVAALGSLPVDSLIVDGELVALDRDGRSDFAALQRQLEAGSVASLRLVVFDLLYLDGIDLRDAPQRARRDLLRDILATTPAPELAFSGHVEGPGAKVFEASVEAGLEGIVSKRADAPYRGGRSQNWIKVKHADSDEFVVVGYTLPRGSRHGFGSLLLATREAGRWRYAGRVGSGFSDDMLRTLSKRLETLRTDQTAVELPEHVPFSVRSVRWVKPIIVVEVHLRGRGKEGLVRQASFLRLRDDKPLQDVEPAMAKPAAKLTSPDRVVFPDDSISKGEVAAYYQGVARWLLPELIKRPLSLVRCPAGIAVTCFFQKHHNASFGPKVFAIELRESDGRGEYLYVKDIDGVLALVQMNTLEFHPWGARVDAPDKPDRLVFDLDPAEGIAWTDIKAAAREVHDRLVQVKLRSWVRLSGGKGLHVVVPIRRGPDWAQAKAFCEAFAETMVAQAPLHYVATASKVARKGRIFIDWLRNTRGATSVCSWSLRARPGATVAMPLSWDELGRTRSAATYDLKKALRRARTLTDDPWQGFSQVRQALPKF